MRHSKQRETILNYLKSVYTHPTASSIYKEVRKEIPNISLGTVYRNLNQLYEAGLIKKIEMQSGDDRFDGTMEDHAHFHCVKCSKVFDIGKDVVLNINKTIEKNTEHKILNNELVFIGICKNCKGKEE